MYILWSEQETLMEPGPSFNPISHGGGADSPPPLAEYFNALNFAY